MPDMTKRSVQVGGIPVGYYHARSEDPARGAGPALTLIHGGTGHPETSFSSLLEHFTRSRTAIVPGYSGSDLTPLPDGEVTVELLADQVAGVIRDAATEPVDLFGISTGAVVAAAVAARDPELVRRVVVLGGFLHYREPWQRLLARTWFRLAELDHNAFAEFTLLHVLSDAGVDAMSATERLQLRSGLVPTEGMMALIGLVSRMDVSEYVGLIKARTLVVAMKQDQLVPMRYARRFREAIPNSEWVEIDSGHAAAIEKPAELLKVVEEFLA